MRTLILTAVTTLVLAPEAPGAPCADAAAGDFFGASVAIDGGTVLGGAWGADVSGADSGAAYLFDAATGAELRKLVPNDGATLDLFGRSVGLSGARAVVGAPQNDAAGAQVGSACVFDTATGTEVARLLPADTVAGAPGDDENGSASGSGYLFGDLAVRFCPAAGALPSGCPCANPGATDTGCDNAKGTGGVGLAVATSLADGLGGGTATFAAQGFPGGTTPAVVLIRSAASSAPAAFGDGVLCLQPPAVRLGAAFAALGGAQVEVGHGAGAGTFHYQAWYRNTPATWCDAAAAFNTTNGLTLLWP